MKEIKMCASEGKWPRPEHMSADAERAWFNQLLHHIPHSTLSIDDTTEEHSFEVRMDSMLIKMHEIFDNCPLTSETSMTAIYTFRTSTVRELAKYGNALHALERSIRHFPGDKHLEQIYKFHKLCIMQSRANFCTWWAYIERHYHSLHMSKYVAQHSREHPSYLPAMWADTLSRKKNTHSPTAAEITSALSSLCEPEPPKKGFIGQFVKRITHRDNRATA